MSDRYDLLLRIDSKFEDRGTKSAEASARTLARELDKVEQSERRMVAAMMQAQREDESRRAAQLAGLDAVGRGFTAVGILAAVGLGAASKAASDWESAWAGVTKTVDGSPEQMAALEEELRGLARTLPATHEEIAGVAEAAGQLGVKREDIASFTKTMIDLGTSTNLSAEDAATGLAQLGNIMGTLPSEAGRAGSSLVALGNDGASTEADILSMSLRIAGAGKTIGLTQGDVMGFASALSSLGIEAEAGGSAISRVMIDISQAVDEGGESLDAFAEVAGVSSDEFARRFREDAAGAVTSFIEGLGRMQESGANTNTVLDDLGLSEIRVRDTLLRTSNAGDLLRESIDLGNESWAANSALLEEANKRYETSESRILTARNQLNDAAIDIGANVLPAVAGLADRVGTLAEGFHGLPDPVKQSVTALGGAVTVIGLLGGAALIAVPKLVAMNAQLAATGPKGAAMAKGLGAVGGVLTGPWGLALAGATLALGVWAEKQYQASQRVEELAGTLDSQTGALTDNTRAMAIKRLEDEGVLAAAEKVGLSLADVTAAALGQADAMTRVKTAVSDINKTFVDAESTGAAYDSSLRDNAESARDVGNAVSSLSDDLQSSQESVRRKAEAMGEDTAATDTAADATREFSTSQQESASATERAKDELDKLIESFTSYGDVVLGARSASRDYKAALDDAQAALTKNKATLNENTKAGRENAAALDDIATKALASAAANFRNGESVDKVKGQVAQAKEDFVRFATQMGMDAQAADALADQLGLTSGNVDTLKASIDAVPPSKTTTVQVNGLETANSGITTLRTSIRDLTGKTITITTRYVTVGTRPDGGRSTAGGITVDSAAGNLFDFAGGGYAPIGTQSPQIRAAGGDGFRWAEQGAGPWEAFISGDPGKAQRSQAIWEDVGRRLGVLDSVGLSSMTVVNSGETNRGLQIGELHIDASPGLTRDYAEYAARQASFELGQLLRMSDLWTGG